jgi:tetratricopeptide (TPR) repeat protein
VLHNLAGLLRARGDYAEAEPLAQRSLAILEQGLGPHHQQLIPSLDSLAELKWVQGNFAEAEALYERALNVRWGGDRSPGELAGVLVDLIDLLELGFIRDARLGEAFDAFFAKANAVFPGPELYVATSGLLVSAGLSDAGEALLLNATERFPVSWLARFRLAEFYADSGRHSAALKEFGNTLELNPPMSVRYRVLTLMGDIHLDLDQLDVSLADYRQAAALGHDDATAAIGMGLLHRRQNRPTEALAAFELAARMDPESAEAHYRLADVYLSLDRWGDAAAAAEKAASLNPAHRRARYLLGRALIRTGHPQEARLAMKEYARLDAEESLREARVLESVRIGTDALEAFGAGDAPKAIALLQDGMDSHPEFARLRLALGLIQNRLGQHYAAIQTLGIIAEDQRGDDSLVHRALAGSYAKLGNTASSRGHTALYLQRIRKELETQLPR